MHAFPQADPGLLGFQVSLGHPAPFALDGYSPPVRTSGVNAIKAVDMGQDNTRFAVWNGGEGGIVITRSHANVGRPNRSNRLAHLEIS